MRNTFKILLISFIAIAISCRSITRVDSKVEIVSRTFDTSLKDSSVICGLVSYAGTEGTRIPNSKIWIENSSILTKSDNDGFFVLKLKPGTYKLNCLGEYSDPQFTATKNISLLANEKVEVKFLIGSISE
jgi:hypothetical protein